MDATLFAHQLPSRRDPGSKLARYRFLLDLSSDGDWETNKVSIDDIQVHTLGMFIVFLGSYSKHFINAASLYKPKSFLVISDTDENIADIEARKLLPSSFSSCTRRKGFTTGRYVQHRGKLGDCLFPYRWCLLLENVKH